MGVTSEVLEIVGKDLVTPMLRQVNGLLGTTAGHGTIAEKSMGRLGGAVSSLTGNIKNLVTSPLGLLGLGGGLFAIDGFLKTTINRAQDFGLAVSNMMAATGLAAPQASLLVDVLDRFGISGDRAVTIMGRAEKNIFTLTSTAKLAAKFWKEFGFNVFDANGKLVDANTLLLRASDYFNGHASAAQKDALMTKLYTKSWTELIPILKLGAKGINSAQQEAAMLGLQLTGKNVYDLAKMRQATLDWNEALGALELQIGVALLPDLVELAKTMTTFVTTHSKDIVAFFVNLAKFAQEVGANVQNDLIPAVEKIVGWWNQLDPNLKKLLIGGFVANTLTGGAIAGLGTDLIKSAASGLIGVIKNMATGSMNVEAGVVNVNGGVGAGGGGGTGLVAGAISVASLAAAAVLIVNANQGNNELAARAAAGDPVAQKVQAEKATRGMQVGSSWTPGVTAASVSPGARPNTALDAIKLGQLIAGNAIGIQVAKNAYLELLHLRHEAHEDHVQARINELARLDHLTTAEEKTKLAIEAKKMNTTVSIIATTSITATGIATTQRTVNKYGLTVARE